ncbi:hypothetical protein AB6D11_00410 [Vibrio splendidus]
MDLYQQLNTLVEEHMSAQPGLFMRTHKEDHYVLDKDTLENDSQSGDQWLFSLKSNGSGTYLNLLDCETEDHNNVALIRTNSCDEDCIHYLLTCTGHNQGQIKQVSQEEAVVLAKTTHEKPNRIPRRKDIMSQIHDQLGIGKKTPFGSLYSQNIHNKFKPKAGTTGVMKISPDNTGRHAVLTFHSSVYKAKPEILGPFTVPASFDVLLKLIDGPIYRQFIMDDDKYMQMNDVTQAEYDKVIKRMGSKRTQTFEP